MNIKGVIAPGCTSTWPGDDTSQRGSPRAKADGPAVATGYRARATWGSSPLATTSPSFSGHQTRRSWRKLWMMSSVSAEEIQSDPAGCSAARRWWAKSSEKNSGIHRPRRRTGPRPPMRRLPPIIGQLAAHHDGRVHMGAQEHLGEHGGGGGLAVGTGHAQGVAGSPASAGPRPGPAPETGKAPAAGFCDLRVVVIGNGGGADDRCEASPSWLGARGRCKR